MNFYLIIAISVLFAQYASEMRKVPETLQARQETWAYQLLQLIRRTFEYVKSKFKRGENTNESN